MGRYWKETSAYPSTPIPTVKLWKRGRFILSCLQVKYKEEIKLCTQKTRRPRKIRSSKPWSKSEPSLKLWGPDSYIASALQNIFSAPSEVPGDPKLTDELRQIRLPEKTVQECDTASPIEEFHIQTLPLF